MRTVCAEDQCAGCMACIDACRFGAVSIKDDLRTYNAIIDEEKCVNCQACHKVCQNNNAISFTVPIFWKQGWAKEEEVRRNSTSGGLATAFIKAFSKNGGIVYSCLFKNGEFIFEKIGKTNLHTCQGSKYVKSNPSGVYSSIKEDLKKGDRVLFIGLPCQVAALKIFVGDKLSTNLYTVDLICHGTPSPALLERFLSQYKLGLNSVPKIVFRNGGMYSITIDKRQLNVAMDQYSISFLQCLSFTENCYQCKYAQEGRVGDLTLGDSWGSELPIEEQRRGVSLILCQTSKGEELIKACNLELHTVDIEKAKAKNHQLVSPSAKPKNREKFFHLLSKGKTFNRATFKCLSKKCIKQKVKAAMIKLGIKKA